MVQNIVDDFFFVDLHNLIAEDLLGTHCRKKKRIKEMKKRTCDILKYCFTKTMQFQCKTKRVRNRIKWNVIY